MALSIDQKRLKATKFPPEFDKKVDIEKVNIDLMKKWIANKITTILGDEDDIVVETCYNLLEQDRFPKIKEIQIQLTGFLNKDTPAFCKELWDLMLSAQESPVGVPRELLEAKKLELQKEQIVPNAPNALNVDAAVAFAAMTAEEVVEGEVEISIADHHAGVRGLHRASIRQTIEECILTCTGDDDPHHHVANVTFTSRAGAVVEVAAGEAVVTSLVSAVARFQAVALLLHHLVAFDAHPLQIAHEHRPDDDADRHHRAGLDHRRRAVHDALPLWVRGLRHDGGGTSPGLQAMIAEGYPNIPRALPPQQRKTSPTHHHPGCHDRVHARLRVAVEGLLAAHQVPFETGAVDTRLPKRIRMAHAPTSRSASFQLV
ncbi:hypothetical protein SNOG_04220 [Parastagonospora nodorum SN15]|uniref:PWI domain-containing protein n=1 Tax=Phaeosphaeria nodorum (strain SN15 / ATCC MYA-4574 / FGSC 10173) TaxID=321614 RepID=Q0UVJ4_PHANO|nr:hypothetical protein SNOG_04220 [Parastagonospora nodorum SN15]EAT87980.2 hypothetical protein SNOG_04220 [Parastagonospora nodorum SN15]